MNLQLYLQVENYLVKSGNRKCFAMEKGKRVLPTVACLVRRPEEVGTGSSTAWEEDGFPQVERGANRAPLTVQRGTTRSAIAGKILHA